jgi:hypothetical protein
MKTMLFRPIRGSLVESMKECASLPATRAALAAHLHVSMNALDVRSYMFDTRIDWDTHIVTISGNAFGFTNSQLED